MKDWLPAYVNGSLHGGHRDRVDAHLADCARCRADLAAWQAIADAAVPSGAAPDPERMVRAVLTRSVVEGPAAGKPASRLRHLAALVVAEARLIRPAVPVVSALVMALGVAIVLLPATTGGAALVLSLLAPIVAAAGVAGTYRSGPELVAATPTSGRLLLLIRLALVFGFDLVLGVAASAALGTTGLHALVGAWLGPMALLSAISLLVAVRFGPDVALGAAVALWTVRVLAVGGGWSVPFVVAAWSTNVPVLAVSAAATVLAVVLAGRSEPRSGWRATHPM